MTVMLTLRLGQLMGVVCKECALESVRELVVTVAKIHVYIMKIMHESLK